MIFWFFMVNTLQRYCNFLFFKMTATTILDFQNRKNLLADWMQRAKTHHHIKFNQNLLISSADIAIFHFFKMATVCHLGFVSGIIRPPTESTRWSQSLCKIWLWSCSSFDNMNVLKKLSTASAKCYQQRRHDGLLLIAPTALGATNA